MKKKILVIDVGGTHVKLMISRTEKQKFGSGPRMTPREMVTQMKPLLTEWNFDAVSIGFPSPVRDGRILSDPKHLGKGWVGFDFEKALGKPVRIINDAAMQALGSYRRGRMLFLGDRKSTRLNSSHRCISYAVFCLKKKKQIADRLWLHFIQNSNYEHQRLPHTAHKLRQNFELHRVHYRLPPHHYIAGLLRQVVTSC